MPYFFEILETPDDDDHLWERLREIWTLLHHDLMSVHFESEDEAVRQVFRKSLAPEDPRFDSWNVARYRETDDRENLVHFHQVALEALGTTERYIRQRQLGAPFLTEWSRLLSCHGFVAAALMARGDDLQSRRAGRAAALALSIDEQRQWFAHYYLRERPLHSNRIDAEEAVYRLVTHIVDGQLFASGVDRAWFEKMLNRNAGAFTKSFQQTRLSAKEMKRLAGLPSDHLPPLDLEIPPP